MNTLKLELGVIGDFLTGSFSTHPLPPKGERGVGLRPEYFSDPSARTAFEEIQKAGSSDPTILERGDKVELIAPSKCRKSFFALDLAIHCAAGIPFRGLAIPKPRKVPLVNLDIKRDWMKRRVLSRLDGYNLKPSATRGNQIARYSRPWCRFELGGTRCRL